MNVDSAARLGDCWQQFPLCSGLHETSEIKAAVINYIQITFCWNGDYRGFLPAGGPALQPPLGRAGFRSAAFS